MERSMVRSLRSSPVSGTARCMRPGQSISGPERPGRSPIDRSIPASLCRCNEPIESSGCAVSLGSATPPRPYAMHARSPRGIVSRPCIHVCRCASLLVATISIYRATAPPPRTAGSERIHNSDGDVRVDDVPDRSARTYVYIIVSTVGSWV